MDGKEDRAATRYAALAHGYRQQGVFLIVVGMGCFALPFAGIAGFGLAAIAIKTLGLNLDVIGRAAEVAVRSISALPIAFGSIVLADAARQRAVTMCAWRLLHAAASMTIGAFVLVQGLLVDDMLRFVGTHITAVLAWSLVSSISDVGDIAFGSVSGAAKARLVLSALLSLGFAAVLAHIGPHVDQPYEAFALLSACAAYAIALGHAKFGVRTALLQVGA